MDRKKMNEDLGNIMHGLSDTSAVPDDIVFVNMPHFPMISESKGLSLMLCSSLRSWKIHGNDCIDCIVDAAYIKERYIYRYFDYRQVFSEQKNHGTITVSIQFAYSDTVPVGSYYHLLFVSSHQRGIDFWRKASKTCLPNGQRLFNF